MRFYIMIDGYKGLNELLNPLCKLTIMSFIVLIVSAFKINPVIGAIFVLVALVIDTITQYFNHKEQIKKDLSVTKRLISFVVGVAIIFLTVFCDIWIWFRAFSEFTR